MKKQISMEVETVASHGGDYITETVRNLEAVKNPLDPRPEAQYSACVALDTRGDLELVWWTNGDSSFLGEDGDNLPPSVLDNWYRQIDAICDEENDAMYDLRDYVGAARDQAESAWKIVVCSNNETVYDAEVPDDIAYMAWTEIVHPVIEAIVDLGVDVQCVHDFRHWHGGPGYGRGLAYTDNLALNPFSDKIIAAIRAAQDKAIKMQTELGNNDAD